MSRAKIEDLSSISENLGLYVEVGSDSENDDWEREQIEKEDEDIRDFVKCHPMPSPDDEGGKQLWIKVIDRLKKEDGVNELVIFSFWRFDIMKRMYENLTDRKVIVDCGKELNRDGEFNAMIIKYNSFVNSDGWTERYKQTLLNTNESDRTLVGWNRKMESVND